MITIVIPPKLKPEDSRPPRNGWAHGNYAAYCGTCNKHFVGAEKATTCADCAYAEPEQDPKPEAKPLKHELVAVHDGAGESAGWGIYVAYDDQPAVEIPWPKDWPEKVNAEFLKARGFRCVWA